MRRLLENYCNRLEQPRLDAGPVCVGGHELPSGYLDLLGAANGFVLHHAAFRLFGVDTRQPDLDVRTWNRSSWVAEYRDLAADVVFIAEDIFGDQYGFRYSGSSERNPVFIKFWCEGGEAEVIDAGSLQVWLMNSVLKEEPTAMAWGFASAALKRGLAPSETEHLSFALPLIAGGDFDLSNIEVAERVFHLHLLGQLSQKNRNLPERTRIARFWSES